MLYGPQVTGDRPTLKWLVYILEPQQPRTPLERSVPPTAVCAPGMLLMYLLTCSSYLIRAFCPPHCCVCSSVVVVLRSLPPIGYEPCASSLTTSTTFPRPPFASPIAVCAAAQHFVAAAAQPFGLCSPAPSPLPSPSPPPAIAGSVSCGLQRTPVHSTTSSSPCPSTSTPTAPTSSLAMLTTIVG